MKLIVTGSRSFIGKALRRACQRRGIGWFGIDLLPPAAQDEIQADICVPELAARLPRDATALVHLAAVSRDTDCRRDPTGAFRVNVGGTLNLIRAAKKAAVPQFLFASSEWVYGDVDPSLKSEETVIDANAVASEYPLTKLAGERLLWIASREGLNVTVLRFGIVYGPRTNAASAVESLCLAVRDKDRIEVGSLATARRFIHVEDVADGILAAAGRSPGYELLNLTGNDLISLAMIIEASCRQWSRTPEVVELSPRTASVRNIDNAKARRTLGWGPRLSLAEGLATLAGRP